MAMESTLQVRMNSELKANVEALYKRITHLDIPVRRLGLCFCNVVPEEMEYIDLFTDYDEVIKERKLQRSINTIKKRFGDNAILKAMNLDEAGRTIERNMQVGGHKANGDASKYEKPLRKGR